MSYTKEELLQAIEFLNEKNLAYICYINTKKLLFNLQSNEEDVILFDHMKCSRVTEKQIIAFALDNKWKENCYPNM